MNHDAGAAAIWRQNEVPVVYRPGKGEPLRVKLPFRSDNFLWLRNDRRHKPRWSARFKCWEVPQAWFDDTVNRLLARFGRLWLIQPYREKEVCAPACWEAKGYECNCSCMGVNHGLGEPGGKWHEVSDACAFQWGDRKLSYRQLTVSGHTGIDREPIREHSWVDPYFSYCPE